MFILKKGHQPGVYVPLRALFLVYNTASVRHQLYSLGRSNEIPCMQSWYAVMS